MKELEQLKQEEKYNKHLERAQKRFEWKSFSQRFTTFWMLSNISQKVLPIISIFTASFFLVETIFEGISNYFSIPLAILILSVFEYAKAQFLQISCENYYQSKSSSIFFSLLTLGFVSGSILMSANGAKTIAHKLTDKEIVLQNSYEQELTALLETYRLKEEKILKSKDEFFQHNKVYLGNQRYAINPKTASTYAQFDQRLFLLEDELKDEKENLSTLWKTQKNTHSENQVSKSWIFFVIAIVFDCLIILCGWFLVWFDYKVLKEDEYLQKLIKQNENTQNEVTIEKEVIEEVEKEEKILEEELLQPIAEEEEVIEESSDSDEPTKEETEVLVAKSGLEAAVQLGIRDYKYLMKTFKCNVQTVKATILKFDAENTAKEAS